MFIDPGSKSSGWALFVEGKLIQHGTIACREPKAVVHERLFDIYMKYRNLGFTEIPEAIHFERLNKRCHHYVMWSIGAIMVALLDQGLSEAECFDDISPGSWQKTVGWKSQAGKLTLGPELEKFRRRSKTEDQLAAIGMGMHWQAKKERRSG